ncbi:hypothetical protein AMS68_003592 [Peltaster fructicola]|uniref:NmrA-like domain-containing protein n=1 Tax=Peltaster fructicola TaxID=286661 RepID=A0A6H0XTV5_9PEZI|nr:hypothetical protein AMS68_003592 [Peltaster fructicola]
MTCFDDGETKICTSTWPQVGRAVAAILSLPVTSDSGPSLELYKNKNVFVNSFAVSQRDMLSSILRVTGDEESEWTIKKVSAHQRVAAAQKAAQQGDRFAYVHIMYTRIFYKDGNGDFEKLGKLQNAALNLPDEDIDEATAVAIERSKQPLW